MHAPGVYTHSFILICIILLITLNSKSGCVMGAGGGCTAVHAPGVYTHSFYTYIYVILSITLDSKYGCVMGAGGAVLQCTPQGSTSSVLAWLLTHLLQ